MLKIEQLNKINTYLCYLAHGLDDNKLTKEANKEIMDLGCKCLDMIDELNKIKEFTER
jgi:hypothetical protein